MVVRRASGNLNDFAQLGRQYSRVISGVFIDEKMFQYKFDDFRGEFVRPSAVSLDKVEDFADCIQSCGAIMETVAATKITLPWCNLIVLFPASILEFNAAALAKANPYSSFNENTSEGPHVLRVIHAEVNFMIPVEFRWTLMMSANIQRQREWP